MSPYNRSKRIEEILDYVLENGGPDRNRMAHPVLKMVKYDDLQEALSTIHEQEQLLHIKPYHFKKVEGVWQGEEGKRNAYGVTSELIQTLETRYEWKLPNIIMNIGAEHFHKEPIKIETPDGNITYTALTMLSRVYDDSPSAAVLDWIHNNEDLRIRDGYRHIGTFHFRQLPKNFWNTEKGRTAAHTLVGDLIEKLKQKNKWTLAELIENITADHFQKETLEIETPDGIITYTARKPFSSKYGQSPSAAVLDWIHNNEDLRIMKGFRHIRPWHFERPPRHSWQDEKRMLRICEVTREVIQSKGERDKVAKIRTPDGTITYSAMGPMMTVFGSTSIEKAIHILKQNGQLVEQSGHVEYTPTTLEEIVHLTDKQIISLSPSSFRFMNEEALVFCAQKEIIYDVHNKGATDYLVNKYTEEFRRISRSRNFFLKGGEKEDLISEYMFGVFKAIQDFDFNRGVAFRTFTNNVCTPRQLISAMKSANSGKHRSLTEARSLNQPLNSGTELIEIVKDPKTTDPSQIITEEESLIEFQRTLKSGLSEFENKVVKYRHEGYSYPEIAETLDCTPKKVDNALNRVRRKVFESKIILQPSNDI